MVGYRGQEGLMIRAVRSVFQQAADMASSRIYTIKMSYLEVYNETIRDLLVPKGCTAALELRDDGVKGVVVSNLTEISPASTEDVLEFLSRGNANRSQCATDANGTSSRSHAVLTVHIEWKPRTADTSEVIRCSKLSLIDLAGCERASATKNKGSVLLEGANINKSLLSLGNCINALASGEKNQFVPYRNSKLTRLLKDSLGGNCKTVMIAAVSPSDACYEDTLNTLKYATSSAPASSPHVSPRPADTPIERKKSRQACTRTCAVWSTTSGMSWHRCCVLYLC
jgi:kinesin family protein 18/19